MAIARTVAALPAALSNWHAARATHRSLASLSDHELADVGLHRGDIEIPALLRSR